MRRDDWKVIGIGHGDWKDQDIEGWGLSEWHEEDITVDSLRRCGAPPATIVHCAGGGSVGASISDPAGDFDRTVMSTLAVAEYVRVDAPATTIVYPSSAAVYGRVSVVPIKETEVLRPVSPYGVHKSMAEQILQSYGACYGVSSVIVRLFSVYGEGLRKQLLWDACMKLSRNETAFGGTGEEIRDWLYVEDAVELLIAASARAAPDCPVVNGGSGRGASVREVLAFLFDCTGRTDTPNFGKQPRAGDPDAYVADITRAQSWGWKAALPWEIGVRNYFGWFNQCEKPLALQSVPNSADECCGFPSGKR